jgi:predicted negative regulator of RcsB-dependent stress response
VLSGKRPAANLKPEDFDWENDQYASQGAMACALRFYETGEPAAATTLLNAALRHGNSYFEEMAWLRALLLHPPG